MGDGTRYEWMDDLEDILAGAGGNKTNDAKTAVTFLNEMAEFLSKLVEEVKNLIDKLGLSE